MVRTVLQAAAGFVWEFTLPRGPDGRIKGFAFAAFTCLAHAQKAIQMVNGKVCVVGGEGSPGMLGGVGGDVWRSVGECRLRVIVIVGRLLQLLRLPSQRSP